MSDSDSTTALRVLVIDDEKDILTPIAEAFRARGVQVDVVDRPLRAEGMILQSRYSAIVTDFKMPLLDGAALVKIIRNSIINRDTPILVISSYIDKPLLVRLTSLGIQDVLVKPFRSVDLVNRVQTLCAG